MPPLILAVLIGAGAYAGYRTTRHWWGTGHAGARVGDEAEVQQPGPGPGPEPEMAVAEKDLGTLEYDPATGVYRPAQRA